MYHGKRESKSAADEVPGQSGQLEPGLVLGLISTFLQASYPLLLLASNSLRKISKCMKVVT